VIHQGYSGQMQDVLIVINDQCPFPISIHLAPSRVTTALSFLADTVISPKIKQRTVHRPRNVMSPIPAD
jgi:hypothetical protein